MTSDLQSIRDATAPGNSSVLQSKGISFGRIARHSDGRWDVSGVEGISPLSLVTADAAHPPSLVIRPFSQASNVVSLREFTNNAFNHHLGIESTERFGMDTDPDGDGFKNEMTRADVTAAAIFQATMAVPGRVIPDDRETREAIRLGETRFRDIGCESCHVSSLPLDRYGWIFSEPNPYNPPTNLRPGDAPDLAVDLTGDDLPPPRLKPQHGVVNVEAYTDLKLHDITSGQFLKSLQVLPPGTRHLVVNEHGEPRDR
jgi:hypothetical protein